MERKQAIYHSARTAVAAMGYRWGTYPSDVTATYDKAAGGWRLMRVTDAGELAPFMAREPGRPAGAFIDTNYAIAEACRLASIAPKPVTIPR